ncbi:MAG: adenylate/guanylate cyclase domain-containing protein [Armatimonadetes bacterium]|nr:adenylate/guanylate cyclase domain-containing protein [Armatimonadota bacterium]
MPTVIEPHLAQKLDAMRAVHALPGPLIERFGQVLASAGRWDVFRMNPLRFADAHGFTHHECTDLMVLAARVGLLDFDWNLLCPACGGVQVSDASIDDLGGDSYCHLCEVEVPMVLDEQVEVSFTINPGVRAPEIDPFANVENYLRANFSENYEKSPELDAYVRSCVLDYFVVEPMGMVQVAVRMEPGRGLHLVCLDRHSATWINAVGEPDPAGDMVSVEIGEKGLPPASLSVPPGPVTLLLRNTTATRSGVLTLEVDHARVYQIIDAHPTREHAFMTGKMLLNHQLFRELFRVQSLNRGLRLNMRSRTILFTDLRGSTALYDRIGDLRAYELIQDHFRILSGAVRTHAGAIVKTMGDAVMATFSTPRDGILAATAMARGMETLMHEDAADLGIKIGLHEGPALAINAEDRIDYFGQTVNIAARVQGLAQAGELVVTESTHRAVGVEKALREAGVLKETVDANLRGVAQATRVLRYGL